MVVGDGWALAGVCRNVGEIRELAGCDNITIAPPLLAELESCTEPLPRKLWPSMRDSSDPVVTHFSQVSQQPNEAKEAAGCTQ